MPASSVQSAFNANVLFAGTNHMHFGIRYTPEDEVSTSLENTVDFLHKWTVRSGGNFGPGSHVLDLGAGIGGSAHFLASKTSCHITCIDPSQTMTARNQSLTTTMDSSVGQRVEAVVGTCESLPAEWTDRFDVVWTLNTFSFVADKKRAVSEAFRVCKPGGVLMLSDAVRSPAGMPESVEPFQKHAGTEKLWTLREYELACEDAGFEVMRTRDLGAHVMQTHKLAVNHAQHLRESVRGMTPEQVDAAAAEIQKLVDTLDEVDAHGWAGLTAIKPTSDGSEGKLRV